MIPSGSLGAMHNYSMQFGPSQNLVDKSTYDKLTKRLLEKIVCVIPTTAQTRGALKTYEPTTSSESRVHDPFLFETLEIILKLFQPLPYGS